MEEPSTSLVSNPARAASCEPATLCVSGRIRNKLASYQTVGVDRGRRSSYLSSPSTSAWKSPERGSMPGGDTPLVYSLEIDRNRSAVVVFSRCADL